MYHGRNGQKNFLLYLLWLLKKRHWLRSVPFVLEKPPFWRGQRLIKYDSPYIRINEKYWSYIMWHMQQEKLIEGAVFVDNSLGDVPYPLEIDKCRITPTGIEYLCENSWMSKAKRFLQDVKDIIPFVWSTLWWVLLLCLSLPSRPLAWYEDKKRNEHGHRQN